MYADPTHLRDREIKARFDQDAYELIDAMARFNRTQRAVLVRELVLEGLERRANQKDTENHNIA